MFLCWISTECDKQMKSKSQKNINPIIENANVAIQTYDVKGRVLSWNKSAEKLYGWKEKEAIGKKLNELMLSKKEAKEFEKLVNDIANGAPPVYNMEWSTKSKKGKDVIVASNIFAIPGDNGKPEIVCMDIDVTEQRKAESAQRDIENRLRFIIDNAPIILFSINTKGIITLSEGKGLEALELKPGQVVGVNVYKLYEHEPQVIKNIDRALKGERFTVQTKLQTGVVFETNFFPIRDANNKVQGLVGVALDITERVRLEEQLRNYQNLESIGRFAGGIAHDFNNLLSVIIGFTEVASLKVKQSDPIHKHLDQIMQASERASELVKQLLTFARKQSLVFSEVNIKEVVEDMKVLLHSLIGKNIKLNIQLEPKIKNVYCESLQLKQILTNLVLNAKDAIQKSGEITITAKNVELKSPKNTNHGVIPKGKYVVLTVADNGKGIPEEVIKFIFDPFFTTKEVGKGTGLGLSTVYGIVTQCKGFVSVNSKIGKGTTFELYFPQLTTKKT